MLMIFARDPCTYIIRRLLYIKYIVAYNKLYIYIYICIYYKRDIKPSLRKDIVDIRLRLMDHPYCSIIFIIRYTL